MIVNMKTRTLLICISVALLTGCNSDNEPATPGSADGRVALEATSGIQTRAYDNTWEANDAIGIYMLNGDVIDSEGNNRQYTATITDAAASSAFSPGEGQTIYFPMDGTKRDFIAYYPYRATLAENNVYTIDVTDQSSQKAIDLMGTTKVTEKDKLHPAVAFTFTHKLVKLYITINADGKSLTDNQLSGTTATITNQQTAATYNVVTGGNATVTTDDAKEIILHIDGLKAEGIVLPTASTASMELTFTVPLLNQTFRWSIDNAAQSQEFKAGSKYLYTITISKTELEVTSTVANWTEGNGENGESGNAQ